jgi:hypothetical protein
VTMPNFVFVTAAPGRVVPIPASDGAAAGAAILLVEPGSVYRVKWSAYVRRRIPSGDLSLTDHLGRPVQNQLAAAADTLPAGFEVHGCKLLALAIASRELIEPGARPPFEPLPDVDAPPHAARISHPTRSTP